MINPDSYCSETEQLDTFRNTLRYNFQSHPQLFPYRESVKVPYAASHLTKYIDYADPPQRQTVMTDPVE